MSTVDLNEFCAEPANNISAAICAVQSVSEERTSGVKRGVSRFRRRTNGRQWFSCAFHDHGRVVSRVLCGMTIFLRLNLIEDETKRSRALLPWNVFCLCLFCRLRRCGWCAHPNFVELVPSPDFFFGIDRVLNLLLNPSMPTRELLMELLPVWTPFSSFLR